MIETDAPIRKSSNTFESWVGEEGIGPFFFEENTGGTKMLHQNRFTIDSSKPVMEGAKHLVQR